MSHRFRSVIALTLAFSLGLLCNVGESSAKGRHGRNPIVRGLIRLAVGLDRLSDTVANVAVEVAGLDKELDFVGENLGLLEDDVFEIKSNVDSLDKEVSAIDDQVGQLKDLLNATLGDCIRVENGFIEGVAGPHVIIEGCNLHVRNSLGDTNTINGRGNLFIGYNESPTISGRERIRDGSHNLVIGTQHNFGSYGGLVAGHRNQLIGEWASVVGGIDNEATGKGSVVAGAANEARGSWSTVSGGFQNLASGSAASVSGGQLNIADGSESSVSGGLRNVAGTGPAIRWSSVSGGEENFSNGTASVVLGGNGNVTNTAWDIAP